jgi:hypothetical protein
MPGIYDYRRKLLKIRGAYTGISVEGLKEYQEYRSAKRVLSPYRWNIWNEIHL